MPERIDARGLSCPQPVVMTRQKLELLGSGDLEVLVDTEAARENIVRLAERSGWSADVHALNEDILLRLSKS